MSQESTAVIARILVRLGTRFDVAIRGIDDCVMDEDRVIHWLVRFGWIGDLALILEGGADPNLKGDLGSTALHLACQSGSHTAVVHLLDAGADPNLLDEWDRTPLDYSIESPEITAKMLSVGARHSVKHLARQLPPG